MGANGPILAKTDGLVYGRHFDDSTPPAKAGAKLLKRNLSDIAAMGGTPRHALVHLVIGRDLSVAWLKEFYSGLADCCREYGVTLAGGGTAQGTDGSFAADLMLLGLPGENILTRKGAKIGDALYVTGELGGSILTKHLDFTPRLAEGQWLAQQEGIQALMDVTDGLAKDLPEILPRGADATLDVAALPISAEAKKLAATDGRTVLNHALADGEDYELLFALDGKMDAKAFEQNWRKAMKTSLTKIGVITSAVDVKQPGQLRDSSGRPLLPPGVHGYEHLR